MIRNLAVAALAFANSYAALADEPPAVFSTDTAGVLRVAEAMMVAGRPEEALDLIRSMRSEDRSLFDVRFAEAMVLMQLGRFSEAEPLLAALVQARPDLTRVRLEHGRALARLGRLGSAERQLQRSLADAPPPGVLSTVRTLLASLRERRRFFGSGSFGLAPDSNINVGSNADSVDLFGIPFDLDPSARQRSGIGVTGQAEIGWRQPLARNLAGIARANVIARIYPQPDTNADDVTAELRLGVERQSRTFQITPEASILRRVFAGQGFATAVGGGLRFETAVASNWFTSIVTDARRFKHDRNPELDGWSGSVRAEFHHPLNASTLLSTAATVARAGAEDPGYANWFKEIDASLNKDWAGGWATTVSGGIGHLEGDAALLAFEQARDDWRLRTSFSIAQRRLQMLGLMPVVRLTYDRTWSPVAIFSFERARMEFSLARAF
jgi:hypothetical protein